MIIYLEGNRKCGTKLPSKRALVQAKREPIEKGHWFRLKMTRVSPKTHPVKPKREELHITKIIY